MNSVATRISPLLSASTPGQIIAGRLIGNVTQITVVDVEKIALGYSTVGEVIAGNQDMIRIIGQGVQYPVAGSLHDKDLLAVAAVDIGSIQMSRSAPGCPGCR